MLLCFFYNILYLFDGVVPAGGSRRGRPTKTWHKTCSKELSETDINWNGAEENAMIKICRLMPRKTVQRQWDNIS